MKTGKIYKLYNQYGVYYGSTICSLKKRLSKHKCDAKTTNISSRILFQDNCIPKIELLEEVEFDDIKELRDREAYYIRNLECINKDIPNRTDKEYKIDNKEQIKQYYQNNKKDILEYQKEYYLDNKDKKKEYYLDNKNKKLEYQKEYYLDNKDKKSKYNKERYQRKKQQDKEVYDFLTYIETSNI